MLIKPLRNFFILLCCCSYWVNAQQDYVETLPETNQTLRMVYIPKGEFIMGSGSKEQGHLADEAPQHPVQIDAFWMAEVEITWDLYTLFMERSIDKYQNQAKNGNEVTLEVDAVSGATTPYVDMSFGMGTDGYPAVCMTQLAAAKFCEWLSAMTGHFYRLPTEAEWAWAARFKEGKMLRYPWGDALPPPTKSANIGDRSAASILGTIQSTYDDGYIVTAPVGQFPPNHLGLYDLGGNAAEWVHDFYIITTGVSTKTSVDPLGPNEGDYHVIRGASWSSGGITDLRLSYRDYGTDAKRTIGFRVARYLE